MQYSHYDIIQDIYVMSTAHISYCKVKGKGCKKVLGIISIVLKHLMIKAEIQEMRTAEMHLMFIVNIMR